MWASASNSLVSSLNRLLLFVSSTQSRNSHLLRWWRDRHIPLVPGLHRALPHLRFCTHSSIFYSSFPCTRVRAGAAGASPSCPWAKVGLYPGQVANLAEGHAELFALTLSLMDTAENPDWPHVQVFALLEEVIEHGQNWEPPSRVGVRVRGGEVGPVHGLSD